MTRQSADERARKGICTVPEGRGIFPNLSVRENLLMATQVGVPMDRIEDVAFAQFPQLSGRRRQMAGTLSGGEQQMLALARAFATDPKLLLLDELSMGLAPIVVGQLYDKVRELAEVGLSILLVEQFARTALPIADSAAVVLQGVVAHGARRPKWKRRCPPATSAPERGAALGGVTMRHGWVGRSFASRAGGRRPGACSNLTIALS